MKKLTYDKKDTNPLWDGEVLLSLEEGFNQTFKHYLNQESFNLEVLYNPDRVQVCMTLENDSGSLFYPIQCICTNFKETPFLNAENTALGILEYLNLYWEDYFSSERDTFVTLDWSCHEHKEALFYIKGYVRNMLLENMANELLQKNGFSDLIVDLD